MFPLMARPWQILMRYRNQTKSCDYEYPTLRWLPVFPSCSNCFACVSNVEPGLGVWCLESNEFFGHWLLSVTWFYKVLKILCRDSGRAWSQLCNTYLCFYPDQVTSWWMSIPDCSCCRSLVIRASSLRVVTLTFMIQRNVGRYALKQVVTNIKIHYLL